MNEPWRTEALCVGMSIEDSKMFFGDRDDMSTHRQHKEARRYCYICPVQTDCLAYAIEVDVRYGIWGGLTESQRKRYLSPVLRKARSRGQKITPDMLSEVINSCAPDLVAT